MMHPTSLRWAGLAGVLVALSCAPAVSSPVRAPSPRTIPADLRALPPSLSAPLPVEARRWIAVCPLGPHEHIDPRCLAAREKAVKEAI